MESGRAIVNLDTLLSHLSGGVYEIKTLCSDRGMVFGPVEKQHLELCAESVRYRPDGKGNALACVVYNDRFELRGDARFNEMRVRTMMDKLGAVLVDELRKLVAAGTVKPGVARELRRYRIYYRGKDLGLLCQPEEITPGEAPAADAPTLPDWPGIT